MKTINTLIFMMEMAKNRILHFSIKQKIYIFSFAFIVILILVYLVMLLDAPNITLIKK